jgi:hypothetical protein
MSRRMLFVVIVLIIISGCTNVASNYKQFGFKSSDEVNEYFYDHLYYARKMSSNDWDGYYRQHPEHWKDYQGRKLLSGLEYIPEYTAFSFRWNLNKRKANWDDDVVKRLSDGQLLEGDNIYKIVYSQGVAARVIWDNNNEILVYEPDKAIIFKGGVYHSTVSCPGCYERYDEIRDKGMDDYMVLKELGYVK